MCSVPTNGVSAIPDMPSAPYRRAPGIDGAKVREYCDTLEMNLRSLTEANDVKALVIAIRVTELRAITGGTHSPEFYAEAGWVLGRRLAGTIAAKVETEPIPYALTAAGLVEAGR